MKTYVTVLVVILALFVVSWARGQDWEQVHREDDEKWSQTTGLSAFTVHRLWRMASTFADEHDDDSHITQVDVHSLVARKEILLVTSSGDPSCLSLSVFARNSHGNYRKVWAELQTPSGQAFCDTPFGDAEVQVFDSVIWVSLAQGKGERNPAEMRVMVYQYGWEKGTYKFIGNKRMNRTSLASSRR
ncbi:MAG: hypothetical protein ACJ71Q_09970 [Terriglobales bacterium]